MNRFKVLKYYCIHPLICLNNQGKNEYYDMSFLDILLFKVLIHFSGIVELTLLYVEYIKYHYRLIIIFVTIKWNSLSTVNLFGLQLD